MFEIYQFEYQCGFITKDDLNSYVSMGILSQPDFTKIVGDENVNVESGNE